MSAHAFLRTDHVRTSCYLGMRDGIRLAIDILRPAAGGIVHDDPRPVIWIATKYQRARITASGQIETILARIPVLRTLLHAGYVIAVLDMRGSGASFGVMNGTDAPTDKVFRDDLHEVATWLNARPWCNGAIGMYGVSYVAGTQIAAAMSRPPGLRCIVPQQVTANSNRGLMKINGIQNVRFRDRRDTIMQRLNVERPAAPVDEDEDGMMLAAAVEEHRAQRASLQELVAETPKAEDRRQKEPAVSPWPAIAASGIAVFHWGSWRDLFPDETLKLYAMLRDTNPSRLVMGPWTHEAQERLDTPGLDIAGALRRWYDFWLKGEDDGYSSEPAVRYVMLRTSGDHAWREAAHWPPTIDGYAELAMSSGGLLCEGPGSGHTDYVVDQTVTTAPFATRYSMDRGEADFRAFDARAATFTTQPFTEDAEIVGAPTLDLWLCADAPDADVFAYLQVVEPDGASRTLTEGMMRASCRHDGTEPLTPDRPTKLRIGMLPTAVQVRAGECLRLAITGADGGVWDGLRRDPPRRLRLHHDRASPSKLILPFLQGEPPPVQHPCARRAANSIAIGASQHD
ncbi:CocE/NonD family hydrolase [Sphingopyxis flava]|nr:CocE/NonD family hydrolase [Sphingopyxis flava]